MNIVSIHSSLANTSMMYFFIISLWGFWRFFRKQGVDGNYWGAAAIAAILIFVQSALGTYMWITGLRPGRTLHILYAVISLAALPTVYAYTKGREERADMLIYATVAIITAILLLRATMTGAPVV